MLSTLFMLAHALFLSSLALSSVSLLDRRTSSVRSRHTPTPRSAHKMGGPAAALDGCRGDVEQPLVRWLVDSYALSHVRSSLIEFIAFILLHCVVGRLLGPPVEE